MKKIIGLLLSMTVIASQIETVSADTLTASPEASLNFEPAVNATPPPAPVSSSSELTTGQIAAPVTPVATGQAIRYATPNISNSTASGSDGSSKAQAIMQAFMGMMNGQSGAPSPTLPNGQPNPAYASYIGGSSKYNGEYGAALNNDYSRLKDTPGLNLGDYKNIGAKLKGHTCSPNDTDRVVCAVCNLMYEAGDQPTAGQLEVARSVLTRTYSGAYKDTVCKNIYAKAQYSWTAENKNHTLPNSSQVDQLTAVALKAFSEGPNGYTNYWAQGLVNPKWNTGNCAATRNRIAGHTFCSINATATRSIEEVAAAEAAQSGNSNRLPTSDSGGTVQ